MNEITPLEKGALLSIGAAAAFKALLWSLNQTADSTDWYIVRLRIVFAALSFVAFDLVIGAVVLRGWSRSGAVALLVAAAVSAALALQVSGVVDAPVLHAAPALTLAAFGLHLMISRRNTEPETTMTSLPPIVNTNTQVNVAVVNQQPATLARWQVPREGFVYVLRSDHGYKIGRAKDAASRMQSIIGFLPFPVESVLTIATGDMYRLEHRLHRCFADRRLRGEWFALSDNDLDTLLALGESIPADQIDDVSDLLSAVVNVPQEQPVPLQLIETSDNDIITLKDVRGLSFAQIGERIGVSRQAAWQQYQTAKRTLTTDQEEGS